MSDSPLEKHAYLRDRNAEYEAQGLTLQESQRAVVELYDYAAALEQQLAAADEVMAGQVVRARAAYEQRCAALEQQLADAQAALERLREQGCK